MMNLPLVQLWVIQILQIPVCVFTSSQFYQALHQAVTQDEVLKTLSNVNTITECVLHCWRHDGCVDAAIQDGGVCLLLKKFTTKGEGPSLPSTTRYGFKDSDG